MNILGISAYYHDSAAALVVDGRIAAACQEERFSRKKHDARFPTAAIASCLDTAGLSLDDVDECVFYDKPLVKFERLLETYLGFAPRGLTSFAAAMPVWLKEKLFIKSELRRSLAATGPRPPRRVPPIRFTEHHQAHAASAFFPSPFRRAAVLCLDGVGEWATTSTWCGDGSALHPLWEIHFPHSLGLLYSALTYYTGFKVNSGEYKLMGLAPYGEPRYADAMYRELIDVKADGTFRLNMRYFAFATGLHMTNGAFAELFGGAPRTPESPVTKREADLAASIQVVTNEVVLRLARTLRRELDVDHLCLAGGVALNCVTNGHLLRDGAFRDLWIQPAAGDAGGALGAALAAWHQYHGAPRHPNGGDSMGGALLGPSYGEPEVRRELETLGARYHVLESRELIERVAGQLAAGKVVGWFQGRMEFGPRALGNRSILGDPRDPRMQSVMNLKIKFRESFRPFAPAVLADRAAAYFELDRPSPYMLLVAPLRDELRFPLDDERRRLPPLELVQVPRSPVPAVTHLDYSARVQTVHPETNPLFHGLIRRFAEITSCPMLVNTSFNVRGEPIVCTPGDAYRCFMRTDIDTLAVGPCLLEKAEQASWQDDPSWRRTLTLD